MDTTEQIKAIKESGMRPEEIAVRLRVGIATVYKWLNGTTPREVYRSKIAALYRNRTKQTDEE